ncbi:MAG: hypothetical protein HY069_04690 [Chlamydiia bacterium]|nr:hypothetical protein [Chlamydiia bacterium]
MNPRAAVFCHNGLGDGVITLVLSQNLHLNGWKVHTYQNTIGSMQNWFPHLPVTSYPKIEDLPNILSSYDWFFVAHNDTDPFVLKLIAEGKRRFPDRLKVIYLYPSPNIVNEPYYSDCQIDPTLPIPENLQRFCQNILHLSKVTSTNGFIPPEGLVYRKHKQRVVIHPTSAREGRNWPKLKFLKLAAFLKGQGYESIFVPGAQHLSEWQIEYPTRVFENLDELARFIYESGFLIGNDSGLAHLASALGIPTLSISRRKAWARFWRPGFATGVVVTPSSWIPNIRGFRLRDRQWKKFVTVGMVQRGFERLLQVVEPASY